jgi:hypothetical protein
MHPIGLPARRTVGLTCGIVALTFLLAACTSPRSEATSPTQTPELPRVSVAAIPATEATAVPTAATSNVPPPATSVPPPTVTAETQGQLVVRGTGGSGLIIRRTPAGERIASANEGQLLVDLNEQARADNKAWRKIRDARGMEGWVASEFVAATDSVSPTATAIAIAPPTPAPAPTATSLPPTPPPVPTAAPAPPAPAPPAPVAPQPPPCCRRCTTGKACGNSCISASFTCRQPAGCACNGLTGPSATDVVSMTPEELEAEAVLLAELNAEPTPCETFALVEGVE